MPQILTVRRRHRRGRAASDRRCRGLPPLPLARHGGRRRLPSVTLTVLALAAAQDVERDLVAGFLRVDRPSAGRRSRRTSLPSTLVIMSPPSRMSLAVDWDVSPPWMPGLGGRAARLDRLDEHARLDGQVQVGERACRSCAGDAEVGALDVAALLSCGQRPSWRC